MDASTPSDLGEEYTPPSASLNVNLPGSRGGWLVLIMQLLGFPADCVCIVPQTLPVEYDRWVQAGVFG